MATGPRLPTQSKSSQSSPAEESPPSKPRSCSRQCQEQHEQHGGVEGLQPRRYQEARAICASPANDRNPKTLAGAKAQCMVPPIGFLRFKGALARASAPIEEGERCHMCDLPAVVLAYHVAWCQDCACAVLIAKGVWATLGPDADGALYKKRIHPHAMEHACRWHRLVYGLMQRQL